MIEYSEEIKPFNYLDGCGDFSIVKETDDYYFCAVADVGGHGSDTVHNIANDIKQFILDRIDLELDELLRLVHSQKILKDHGMTLGLMKIFKHSSLISYVGVGNIKAMIVNMTGDIIEFKFQEGIVGYTMPTTIVTNILKIKRDDTLILNTDGISISKNDMSLNLMLQKPKEMALNLIKHTAKDDDDSLCLVIKYFGIKNGSLQKTIQTPKNNSIQKHIQVKKTKVIKPTLFMQHDNHTFTKIDESRLLLKIFPSDKKIKDKLSKIFNFFKLDKKNIVKTSLFLIELQKLEQSNINIYYLNNTIQIKVESLNKYRDTISCLFQYYRIEDTDITIDILVNNFIYEVNSFANFKELLKFGLDEEAMMLNKKLQEEVDKKLQELLEKEQINATLTNKAYIDNLTGSYNRYKFEEVFNYELEQFRRYNHSFCIAMIDIDHFKKFNDTYGHLIGDEVLIMLANESKKTVRTTDTFARWGGEEFLILFSETTLEDSKLGANKLRKNISELEHKIAGHITASFGVSQIKKDDTLDDILQRCDDALYRAKDNGRNRVEIQE